jgi:DNA repair ATPase RecN
MQKLEFAEKYPHLYTMLVLVASDSELSLRHEIPMDDEREMAFLSELEVAAANLDQKEKEFVAIGENSEVAEMVKSRGNLEDLDHFLNSAFDGEVPVFEFHQTYQH